MLDKAKNIYMIGIGGCGMSAIAEVLFRMGYKVSGSDLSSNDYTKRLENLGIKIFKGHSKKNLKDADLVIISSAIKEDNPELKEAKKRGIPVVLRGEALGWLMSLKDGIAVAGTHGKTTTTSMIAKTLICAGLDPTVLVGGKLKWLGSNVFFGKGRYILAEADESDGTFLSIKPKIAVVTNIDADHLDFYKNFKNIKKSFQKFMENVPDDGINIVCGDDKNIKDVITNLDKRFLTYGFDPKNHIFAKIISLNYKSSFDVFWKGKKWDRVILSIPGVHNVLNALAVIGVGIFLGIPKNKIFEALSSFEGVGRRIEVKGEKDGILVIDDYGHHPKEIEVTLSTVKNTFKPLRLITVFQPHRYSRTKALYKEFCKCFKNTDLLILTSIYPAGEKAILDVKESKLCEEIKNCCPDVGVLFCPEFEDCVEKLKKIVKKGDVILTIGAGDVWKVGEMFLKEK